MFRMQWTFFIVLTLFSEIFDFPNILNLQDGRAMIVDFDWNGLAAQVFYPMRLNKQWPPGGDTGAPTGKSDDLFMLKKL